MYTEPLLYDINKKKNEMRNFLCIRLNACCAAALTKAKDSIYIIPRDKLEEKRLNAITK